MDKIAHPVFLRFDPDLDRLDKEKKLRDGLSAVVLVDDKGRRSVLILYDAPSEERKKSGKGEAALRADVFALP